MAIDVFLALALRNDDASVTAMAKRLPEASMDRHLHFDDATKAKRPDGSDLLALTLAPEA